MMAHTLSIRTSSREELVDLTQQIQELVRASGVRAGMVFVTSPHTTAGITIQENADPDVRADLLAHLAALVPRSGSYRHSEGNSDAHIKSSLMGSSLTLFIEGGKLVLGTWQTVYFCEFDGPRERKVAVRLASDE